MVGTYEILYVFTCILLDQYCNPVKVEYSGFSITWNATLAGITVEAPCTGPGLNGAILKQHQLRT